MNKTESMSQGWNICL